MYGTFKLILLVDNFRIYPTDLIVESGSNDFVFLSRQNHVYKFYFENKILKKKENIYDEFRYNEKFPNLYRFISIKTSGKDKSLHDIEDFRIFEGGSFIYISTKSNSYFNTVENF